MSTNQKCTLLVVDDEPYILTTLAALLAPDFEVFTADSGAVHTLRQAFGGDIALFKIGRFSPDKRWIMAMEAVALLNRMGTRTRILIRGDRSSHGPEVLARARDEGLVVEDLTERYGTVNELAAAIAASMSA